MTFSIMAEAFMLLVIILSVVAAFHVILKAGVLFNVCREIVIPQENIKAFKMIASWAKMMSPGGKLTTLATQPKK
jgi:hypothetical protein